MAKDDFTNGVWRTVGGRRIFIRDGQSLSDAMKSSGKFKTHKQETEDKLKKGKEGLAKSYDDQELKDEIDHYNNMIKEMERRLSSRYEISDAERDKLEDRAANYESRRDELKSELESRKSGKGEKDSSKDHLSQEEWEGRKRAKAELDRDTEYAKKQYEENGDKKLYDQRMETINKAKEELISNKKQQGVQKLKDKLNGSKEEDEVATVRSQMSELEEASGSKVKDAFQTDLFGNGKENRFILEDGTIVGHTLESFGEKTDDWYVGDRHFKNYDEVKSYLSGGSKKGKDEFEDISKELREISSRTGKSDFMSEAGQRWNELYKKDRNNVGRDLGDGYRMSVGYDGGVQISSSHPYDETDYSWARKKDDGKWEVRNPLSKSKTTFNTRDEALKEMKKIDDHIRSGEKTMDYEGITKYKAPNQSSNKAYKNAFEEYKKKHPNTKLTLQKFINMSEGK